MRHELWSALVLFPLFRADLRVLVDPLVTASDANLSGGAICRSVVLTARGLEAVRQARAQQTSLSNDEVALFCFNDNIGAGRRALEILHLEVAAFVWIGSLILMQSEFVATPGLTCRW